MEVDLMKKILVLLTVVLFSGAMAVTPATAADTSVFTNILESMDQTICSSPKKLLPFYKKDAVLMSDETRINLEEQIEDYERMIAEFEEMKCVTTRTTLGGKIGEKVGYLIVDEIVNVSSRLSTDDRQHSFCNYVFEKEGTRWKVALQQCASLPDYTIDPNDDALYYFHNPVY
jgi:hypothetical protein